MNPIESLADKAFIINLAHRDDRWKSVQEQLATIGYENYERFDAYGVKNLPSEEYTKDIKDFEMSGWWGNKFSHYGVIDEAKKRGYKSVMVFEDDVVFHPQFNDIARAAISQLDKWDWLQFGGNHRYFGGVDLETSPIDGMKYLYPRDGLEQVKPNLAKIHKMLTAHAYIVRENVYDFILDNAIGSSLSIDGFYAYEVHPRFNCYCVIPCAAKQIPGMNDIGNCYSDYRPYIGD